MNDEIAHLVKLAAGSQDIGFRAVLYGHISVYDPTKHRVKAMVPSLPSGGVNADGLPVVVETPWMPLGTVWVGNGFGMQIAPLGGATQANPTAGERVRIIVFDRWYGTTACAELDFTDQQPPPDTALQPGEALLKHMSGSSVKFTAAGDLLFTAARDATISAGRNASLLAPGGTVTVSGNIARIHGATEYLWDVNGYGVDYLWTTGDDYTITSYSIGAVITSVTLPINQPEIPT